MASGSYRKVPAPAARPNPAGDKVHLAFTPIPSALTHRQPEPSGRFRLSNKPESNDAFRKHAIDCRKVPEAYPGPTCAHRRIDTGSTRKHAERCGSQRLVLPVPSGRVLPVGFADMRRRRRYDALTGKEVLFGE
jgi:hypothetical protein